MPVSRRSFLAAMLGSGVLLRAQWTARQAALPVPPSVMLHARQAHLDNLPRLVDWLFAGGYTPVTYRMLWDGLTAGAALPASPVIVSIDDLILVKGSNNFAFIQKMVNILIDKKFPAVIALNTEPIVFNAANQPVQLHDQDDTLWAEAAAWTGQGIELATHTQSHQNLADPSLTAADFQREIGGSAQMITDRTGQPVITLVLPYGNGTLGGRQDASLLPPIIDECHRSGIGVVVGIAGGRIPLVPAPASTHPIYFVGRVGPETGRYDTIYGDIDYWHAHNTSGSAPGSGSDLP